MAASSSTTKFQLTLPLVLHSISPGLAAYHVSRARALGVDDPALATSHCKRCGGYLFDGTSEIRVVRPGISKRRKLSRKLSKDKDSDSRVVSKTCLTCGYCDEVTLDRGNATLFPMPRKRTKTSCSSPQGIITLPTDLSHARNDLNPPKLASMTPSPLPSRSASQIPTSNPVSRPSSLPPTAKSTPESSSVPGSSKPARSKGRNKKTGLQDMLARNRERERQEQQKKAGEGSAGGLAAFLSGL
ncbi:hypothetical protein JAAARDRAFT_230732 [Jaapia argillacea MUCL 33604]|uniref:Uncharacterized protein n=1 Tax=Jaapia argillacea MUCL 33604 TaxID=933084 RepID=A0A067QM21_9AGAM|nr:hypothetical protein JAAARDRAFT_230732 [Jaapia argillacea MUCL 33604]